MKSTKKSRRKTSSSSRTVMTTTEKFERLAGRRRKGETTGNYQLRLYIAGMTDRSRFALKNIKKICEDRLKGKYDLEVVDIYQQPEASRKEQIIAVPMLVKQLPEPIRRLLGDLSDEEKVMIALDIQRPEKGKE